MAFSSGLPSAAPTGIVLPRWWQADTYSARVNDLAASGITKPGHGWLFNSAMSVAVIGGLVLAGYGWYVLTYIAKT